MADAIRVSGPINAAGLEMTLETGKLAPQADGAVLVQVGDTTLLSTVVTSKPREGIDFFPLTVDVEERMYAAGQDPRLVFRREGRPGEPAILTCRLTDRPLRPSFPDDFRNEVQVDRHHHRCRPREPARHRVDQRRVGRAHGVGHPVRRPDRRGAPGAPRGRVDRAPHVPRERRVHVRARRRRPPARRRRHRHHDGRGRRHRGHLAALRRGRAEGHRRGDRRGPRRRRSSGSRRRSSSRRSCAPSSSWHGPDRSRSPTRSTPTTTTTCSTRSPSRPRESTTRGDGDRRQDRAQRPPRRDPRGPAARAVRHAREPGPFASTAPAGQARVPLAAEEGRAQPDRQRGPAHRRPRHRRPPSALGRGRVLPTSHGSGLFQRGETQVLSVLTLGMPRMEQLIARRAPRHHEALHAPLQLPAVLHRRDGPRRFAEASRDRPRRARRAGARAGRPVEAGVALHAARRLRRARSNGSTSMASVCGSTLSLMDGGVPIKAPVAGIAMGLVYAEGKYTTLTDILGTEDAFGDMDFKVAGTREFVTALSSTRRSTASPPTCSRRRCCQAKDARLKILDVMDATIAAPRDEVREHRTEDRQLRDPDGQDRRGDRAQGQGHQHDPAGDGRRRLGAATTAVSGTCRSAPRTARPSKRRSAGSS